MLEVEFRRFFSLINIGCTLKLVKIQRYSVLCFTNSGLKRLEYKDKNLFVGNYSKNKLGYLKGYVSS